VVFWYAVGAAAGSVGESRAFDIPYSTEFDTGDFILAVACFREVGMGRQEAVDVYEIAMNVADNLLKERWKTVVDIAYLLSVHESVDGETAHKLVKQG
jgi:hypothetical protein